MSKKPLIGIVSKPRLSQHGWNLMYTNEHIKEAIILNGGLVIGIVPQGQAIGIGEDIKKYKYELSEEERKDFYSTLELCDGLILEGGLTSSFYEEEVARYAYNNNVPILGICSGQRHQITAFGGDNQLIKGDIDRHNDYENELVHEVLIKKDSYFYSIVGAEKIMVNSYHENISYNTGIYEAVGYSDDGLIEVTELKNKTFNIGVRFHPELLFKKDKKMNNIFTEFIKFCKKYQDNKLNLVSNKK